MRFLNNLSPKPNPMHYKFTILLCLLTLIGAFAQGKKSVKEDSTKKEKKKDKNLPLEVGRRIRIQTDEGTWMSLDVSPDGKTIAFDFFGRHFYNAHHGRQANAIHEGHGVRLAPEV